MEKQAGIKWSSKLVAVAKIKKTPKNYKIRTELGRERLQQSLKSFGLAGNVVLNTDLTLIDGNSRIEEAIGKGEKMVWASIPNRKLTPKEFTEMSAMFDFAKAGEVDIESIKRDLGKTKDFYDKYKMEVPFEVLEKLGGTAPVEGLTYPGSKKTKGVDRKEAEGTNIVGDIRMVSLFFSEKQEAEFRKWEAVLEKKFKTDNVTDTVYKAIQHLIKLKK